MDRSLFEFGYSLELCQPHRHLKIKRILRAVRYLYVGMKTAARLHLYPARLKAIIDVLGPEYHTHNGCWDLIPVIVFALGFSRGSCFSSCLQGEELERRVEGPLPQLELLSSCPLS